MELTTDILLNAYCQGVFPMAEEDGAVHWYDPDPRAIIPLDKLHISRSLQRRLRRGGFEIRFSTAFRQVMEACAASAPGREQTWISAELIDLYTALHEQGYAHSTEVWVDEVLVGGVYGVAIGRFFAGESMFSRTTDASKIALVHLVDRLRDAGCQLFDVQFITGHLKRFGAIEISRADYKKRLAEALKPST